MAIYHFSMKTISRSHGRSATAAIAYRAGTKITDLRTGEIHDYRNKKGVISTGIIVPNNAPEWAKNREKLWNAVEQKETRKNSTVAREIIVALPAELNKELYENLILNFSNALMKRHQCAVDFAIHEPSQSGDNRNYHAHILMSTRRLTANGFTEKTRELDERNSGEIGYWRKEWADLVNSWLCIYTPAVELISHLSLEKQGIEREPTKHKGVAVTAMERKQKFFEPIDEVKPNLTKHLNDNEIENLENELENLLLERSYLVHENNVNLQTAKHFCNEMLDELPDEERIKLVNNHENLLRYIDENVPFKNDELKTEYLLDIYERFYHDIEKVIQQQPEPEIKSVWEQYHDYLNATKTQLNDLSKQMNDFEQSGRALFDEMDKSGLYAYQGIISLKNDLNQMVISFKKQLNEVQKGIDLIIQAWELDDIDKVERFILFNEENEKIEPTHEIYSQINKINQFNERVENFINFQQQRFEMRLAEHGIKRNLNVPELHLKDLDF